MSCWLFFGGIWSKTFEPNISFIWAALFSTQLLKHWESSSQFSVVSDHFWTVAQLHFWVSMNPFNVKTMAIVLAFCPSGWCDHVNGMSSLQLWDFVTECCRSSTHGHEHEIKIVSLCFVLTKSGQWLVKLAQKPQFVQFHLLWQHLATFAQRYHLTESRGAARNNVSCELFKSAFFRQERQNIARATQADRCLQSRPMNFSWNWKLWIRGQNACITFRQNGLSLLLLVSWSADLSHSLPSDVAMTMTHWLTHQCTCS